MDGREGMAMQGSVPYYVPRGIQGSIGSSPNQPGLSSSPGFRPTSNPSGPGQPGLSSSPGFRPTSNPNLSNLQQVRAGSSVGPAFNVEESAPNVPQGFTITVASNSTGGLVNESGKKKRGRPRKYGPDGSGSIPGTIAASGSGGVSLGLSPSPLNSNSSAEKRKRGRPRGSGRKQRLASVGDWMNNSAGVAFTPHVIHIAPGEDITAKVLSFAQQRPRALCIMSGSGGVSSVTLRQPASSGVVSYEDRFEILCLSGSYLIADTGGSRNRIGGVNVSLSNSDGHLIGGAAAQLIASRPVQVVVCSFVYGNAAKGKTKESDSKEEITPVQMNASPSQNVGGSWPGSKGVDLRNPNTDIDLAGG